jgi:hypothetical protein
VSPDERLALGHAAVLSPSRAAELLPWRESEAIEWLRSRGLVRRVHDLGRDVVIWGEVIEALRTPAPDRPAPRGTSLRRSKL